MSMLTSSLIIFLSVQSHQDTWHAAAASPYVPLSPPSSDISCHKVCHHKTPSCYCPRLMPCQTKSGPFTAKIDFVLALWHVLSAIFTSSSVFFRSHSFCLALLPVAFSSLLVRLPFLAFSKLLFYLFFLTHPRYSPG